MTWRINHLYEFGEFRLDTAEHLLLRRGRPVPLAPKAFETLLALVERGGHLIEKDELLRVVWKEAFVEEANLARCVHTLRRALGEERGGQKYIETVPKLGYRFVAEVREVRAEDVGQEPDDGARGVVVGGNDEPASETGGAESPQGEATSANDLPPITQLPASTSWPAPLRRRTVLTMSALASVLLVAAGVAASFYSGRNGQADKAPVSSIAVLPFVNASGDPEMEYLSDGLSESLINAFAELPQLKVIARSSSFKFRGENVDAHDVARKLGVQAVVTGRVVRIGDQLQVSAEMVETGSDRQMWGGRYSRRATDLQDIQEEMARTIAEKLRARLTGEQEQRLAKRAAENPEAYRLYLNGEFYIRKNGVENIRKALDYYNQSIAAEANLAPAHIGRGMCYRSLASNSVLDPMEANAAAKAAAQKALELDEKLADAHVVLAGVKTDEWDWAGVEHEFNRAIHLNPNSASAHATYAFYLSNVGRHAEALAENKRAQELDPLSISHKADEGFHLFFARRYDESIEKLRQVINLEPDNSRVHFIIGYTYEAKGMYAEAIAEHKKAMSLAGETTSELCYLGYAFAKLGQRDRALSILDRLKTTKEYISPYELATLYLGLGEKDEALALLEKAYSAHDLQMQYVKVDPHLDSLHSDPRFQEIVRKMGLPQ